MPSDITKRIAEAHEMVRRFAGTSYESAALAYLRAQRDIAARGAR